MPDGAGKTAQVDADKSATGASRLDIEVRRFKCTNNVTCGNLYVNGIFQCVTLEDPVRDLGPKGEGKVYGNTAIPAGHYRIIINMSQRFGRFMMRLLDVPHFTGILIHGGNTTEDTHGCILVGNEFEGDRIKAGTSTPAVKALFAIVHEALSRGAEVWLTIG